MKIKQFIEQQKEKGVTLYRLANVLEISHPAISAHWYGMAERVNINHHFAFSFSQGRMMNFQIG